MGGCYSKRTGPFKIKGKGKGIKNIPSNSPLGELLERWDSLEATEGLDKNDSLLSGGLAKDRNTRRVAVVWNQNQVDM